MTSDEKDERVPLLGAHPTISVQVQYESMEEVSLPLPGRKHESCESTPSASHPHSINIDEPAHKSYVCLGYTFSIIAGFCFTSWLVLSDTLASFKPCFFCSNVGIKFAGINIEVSSWQMLFVRCLSQMLLMVPIILWKKANLLGTPDFATRWRMAAQSIVGGLMLLSIFEAVQRLPIGDCTAIFFSSPACTLALSVFLLRDHCGLYRMFIGCILLSGVVVISRPPAFFPPDSSSNANNVTMDDGSPVMKQSYDFVGLGFALAVPLLSAWIAIITR